MGYARDLWSEAPTLFIRGSLQAGAPGSGAYESQDTAFVLSWRAGGSLKEREPDLDYDEVIVCMMLAFCIGNAMITLIYRIMA